MGGEVVPSFQWQSGDQANVNILLQPAKFARQELQ